MALGRLSGLWRSVAPWYPAVAWIWFACAVVFVSTSIAHGIEGGTRGTIAVFLAWAIVREIAPRRFLPAALAPVAAVAFAIPVHTSIPACVAVLIAARVASRSTGIAPTWLDAAGVLALVAWCATQPAALPAALVLAAVTVATGRRSRLLRIVGAGGLVGALVIGSVEGTLVVHGGWDDHATAAVTIMGLAAVGAVWILLVPLPARLRARTDRTDESLYGTDVRTARFAVVGSVIATIVWTGTDGAFLLSSASAAILATALGGARVRAARRPVA